MALEADKLEYLCEIGLLKNLDAQQLASIGALIEEVVVQPNEFVIRENEISDGVYVIWDGEVVISKEEPTTSHRHTLTTLKKGAIIGELALLDNAPRSASVRTTKKTTFLVFSIQALHRLRHDEERQDIYFNIIENITRSAAGRMRTTNDVVIDSLKRELSTAKAHVAMGVIIITVALLTALYILVIDLLKEYHVPIVTGNAALLIISSIIIVVTIKNSGYPISVFGLTFKNGWSSLKEAVVFTIPVLLILFIVKWLLIKLATPWYGDSLIFSKNNLIANFTDFKIVGFLAYFILIPFHELVVRGTLQGSLEELLVSPHKKLLAILMSNFLFTVTYAYLSMKFMLPIFLLGLYLGWLYSRNRTLVGVIFSHSLIAAWCFFILNIRGDMLNLTHLFMDIKYYVFA